MAGPLYTTSSATDAPTGTASILAMGSTGAGKTEQFLTLPGKKFIYLFDPAALETLRGYPVDYASFLPETLNINAIPLSKQAAFDRYGPQEEPTTYVKWEEDFYARHKDGFFDQYDWIGVDSMTTFQALVMDRVLWLNGRYGKWPEQDDYAPAINAVHNFIRMLTGHVKKGVYCTGHIEYGKTDNKTKMVINQFSLLGALRNRLPLLFAHVLRLYTESSGQDIKYMVQTKPDDLNKTIRSSLKNAKTYEDITLSKDQLAHPEGRGLAWLLGKG